MSIDFDVYLTRKGKIIDRQLASGPGDLDMKRANFVRNALRAAQPYDKVLAGPGRFAFGGSLNVEIPHLVDIDSIGGPDVTEFHSDCHDIDNAPTGPQGAAFKPLGSTHLSGITFSGTGDPGHQQTGVGWIGDKTPGTQADPSGFTLTMTNCGIKGFTFGGSIWAGYGNRFVFDRLSVTTPRWALTAGCSGGDDACFIRGTNLSLYVNTLWSGHRGAQGFRGYGLAARGGSSDINWSKITVVSDSRMLDAACVWSPTTDTTHGDSEAGSPYTKVSVFNTVFDLLPNGSQNWNHIAANCGQAMMGGCSAVGQPIKQAGDVLKVF